MRIILGSLLLAVLPFPAFAHEDRPVRVEAVSVHLFLENTGTFSDDVTQIKGFFSHNFSPGGSEFTNNDRFNSFLIKVKLASDGETFQPGEQVKVIIKEQETGNIVQETSIGSVYVGPGGVSYYPFLVTGHVCTPLTVEVVGKPKNIVKQLSFMCGE